MATGLDFLGIAMATSTTKKGCRAAKDAKEQILKRIKDEGITVSQASQEHRVSGQTLYAYLTKGILPQPSLVRIRQD